MVRQPTNRADHADGVTVLLAEWVRFGAGGGVMLAATILAAVAAFVYIPLAVAAGGDWVDANSGDTAAAGSDGEVSGLDMFADVAAGLLSAFAAIPGVMLGAVVFLWVFLLGRLVSFWVLRRLIARSPRWEQTVTGTSRIIYHSNDPQQRRQARMLYGFAPYPSGLIGRRPQPAATATPPSQ